MHPAVSSSAATVRVTSEGVSARLKHPSLALFKRYSPAPDFWNRLFSTVFLNFSVFNVPVSSSAPMSSVLQCLQCSSVFSVPVSSVFQCLQYSSVLNAENHLHLRVQLELFVRSERVLSGFQNYERWIAFTF